MADKTPLDDDELDAVTGGVTKNQVVACNDCQKIDSTGPKTCNNCWLNGGCIHQ